MACRLYLITPPQIADTAGFLAQLPAVFESGDVACLQLRLKGVDDDIIRRTVEAILPVCARADVALILNDRPDLAASTGCDGVHIGPEDMSYGDARKLVGAEASVGVSCKTSRHLAMTAAEAGADYVAFGAFFPSNTKQDIEIAPIQLIEVWSETTNVPSVAIGGITIENCQPLIEAGADFLAVSAGVWAYKDGPESAVRSFSEIMAQ
ncbi:MAG: thiamine phosphate synthase [Rhodospirillaceae bacterium]